jgi:phosphate transport system permease protein
MSATTSEPTLAPRAVRGAWFDPVFKWACGIAATVLLTALGGMLVVLVKNGWPAFQKFGLNFLLSSTWNPVTEEYGAAGPILGTLISSFLALAMALPLAIGVSVFLVEFCPKILARPIAIAVELLAGIPSIVYGMWGLFVFAPFFAAHVQLPLMMATPDGAFWSDWISGVPNGANIFTASVILTIMILPYMAAVYRELLVSIPPQVRESAYGLGALPVEVMRSVCLPYIARGMVGASMLGLGRALGETMAVTFIIGNSHDLPKSLFASGATLASTIANEFAEASTPMHTAALVALGLVLFVITFSVLAIARALLSQQRYS